MTARTTGEAGRRTGGSLDEQKRGAAPAADPVTQGLRQLFAAVEEEPVPDEFLRLLDAIDEQRGRAETPAPAAAGTSKAG